MKNEITKSTGKWMDLESMLSKVNQNQKEKKTHVLLRMWLLAYSVCMSMERNSRQGSMKLYAGHTADERTRV